MHRVRKAKAADDGGDELENLIRVRVEARLRARAWVFGLALAVRVRVGDRVRLRVRGRHRLRLKVRVWGDDLATISREHLLRVASNEQATYETWLGLGLGLG